MKRTLHIADLFCGAGGTSHGAVAAVEALGFKAQLTAINHWNVAIATHQLNNPEARHLCTSLDNVNPRELFKDGELDVLWASPECTHHSIARGGKPINDQSRATAWCVVRWAEALRPAVILVENVPEFVSWGAIGDNGRPLKRKKGATFMAWKAALESLGYRVGHRILCAADYGDPTTRRRLFVQCVRGHRKIVWPEPSHAPLSDRDLLGSRLPYRNARNDVIDWSLLCPSIYERKRPLSDKTMRRIFEGLKRFGLGPFIVPQQSNPVPKGVEEPLGAVVAEGSGPKLAQAFIMSAGGPVCPARSVDDPVGTVLTRDHRALVAPFIIPHFGERKGQRPRTHSTDDPVPAVTSHGAGSLVQPFIVAWDHTGGNGHCVTSVDSPMTTVTSKARHGVAQPFLVELRGTSEKQLTQTARSTEDPLPTITAGGGHIGVVQPGLLPQQSGGILRPVSEPVPTVTTGGAIALVEPFLVKYHGTGGAHRVDVPLDTVPTKDRFGLVRPTVEINGETYLLDIGFRMLQPHELAAAQGFPKDYQFTGNKTQQVKQIGNAVPCGLARALVHAVLSQNPEATS